MWKYQAMENKFSVFSFFDILPLCRLHFHSLAFCTIFNFMLHFAHNKVKLKIMEIKINVMDTLFALSLTDSFTCALFRWIFFSLEVLSKTSWEETSYKWLLLLFRNNFTKLFIDDCIMEEIIEKLSPEHTFDDFWALKMSRASLMSNKFYKFWI